VLPNLYYRTVREFDSTASAQDDADRARERLHSLFDRNLRSTAVAG
jgi:hypothetical protein